MFKMIKDFLRAVWTIQTLLYIALILALLASLKHVAFAFATTNGGDWFEAYVSAIAIDLGMLALAAGINRQRYHKRPTKWLWLGVATFSVISTYANWIAGIVHVTPIDVELGSMAQWLVSLRPIVLSGVLPLLVIYLSEIVSGDYRESQIIADKEAKKAAKVQVHSANDTIEPAFVPGDTVALEKANQVKQETIETRRQEVLIHANNGMTQAEIAELTGYSLSTVKRDLKQLNGKVAG